MLPSSLNLYGVFAVSPSLAFAVGDPAVNHAEVGWNPLGIHSLRDREYSRSVWMVSSTDGWAVGDAGTIVRWNGAAWAAETSPTPNNLNAVQALTSTDVWAVGDGGTIIHRDGIGWTLVPSGTAEKLDALYMLSATEGWAVGGTPSVSSVMLFWNGSTWAQISSVPVVTKDLRDVWMVASTDGWAVGQNGLITQFGPGARYNDNGPCYNHLNNNSIRDGDHHDRNNDINHFHSGHFNSDGHWYDHGD